MDDLPIPTAPRRGTTVKARLMRALPLWDVLAVLLAARLSTGIYVLLFAAPGYSPGAWPVWERWALPLALLATFLMPHAAQRLSAVWPRLVLFALLAGAAALAAPVTVPIEWLVTWLAMSCLALGVLRALYLPRGRQSLAIVGCGPVADRLIRHLRRQEAGRFNLVGVFDDRGTRASDAVEKPCGSVADLISLGRRRHIDWILLTLPGSAELRVLQLVGRIRMVASAVALCPQNVGMRLPWQRLAQVGDTLPVTLLANAGYPGWEIDDYDLSTFTEVAARFGEDTYSYVVTPNVDHLIRLHDDPSFRALYADAGFVLLDSRFLARLLRVFRGLNLPVCTGSDLTTQLFERVVRPDDRIVLVGATEEQAQTLARRYGLARLAHHNPPMGFARDAREVEQCLAFVEAHSPFRFCLLAVGSPQQEMLAQRLQDRGRARGLALCVGASIDFLTGAERRAPEWMQRAGLEWLYRLLQAPRRLAHRYLVRGPRVFGLLGRTEIVLRGPAL